MNKRKLIALTLASSMLFSASLGIAGCSKSTETKVIKNSIEEISADELWFNYSKSDLNIFDDGLYLSSSISTELVKVDGGYATHASATPLTYDQIHYRYVLLLDDDCNLIDKIEIDNSVLGVPEDGYVELLGLTSENGDPVALVRVEMYDAETYEYIDEHYQFNVKTKEIKSIDYLYSDGYVSSLGGLSNGYVYSVCEQHTGDGAQFWINFGKDGQLIQSIDLTSMLGETGLSECYINTEIGDIVKFDIYGENNNYLFTVNTDDWSTDKSVTTFINIDEDSHYRKFIGEDGIGYLVKEDGIYYADNDKEIVLPFDASYANRYSLYGASLVETDGNRFILVTNDYTDELVKTSIHVFDLADSNPNVGKTIITVGYMEELDINTAEVISEYNQSSDLYYVKTMCYQPDMTDVYSEIMSSDEYNKASLEKSRDMSDELVMDLLSGEGPDIILNTFEYPQLNNETYLIDMSSFVDEELKDIELFDNVIEASKTDSKLYQVPLTFYVEGIFAQADDVKGECGFTFDEYIEYVDTVCNGSNPIGLYSSRLDVMTRILSSMSNEFYDEDGNVDFNNEAFYSVVKYCKENVPENYWSFGNSSVGYGYTGNDNQLMDLYNIDTYLTTIGFNPNLTLYGIPSFDGRGPSIGVTSSVAISAAVCDVDGAKDFVKKLLCSPSSSSWTNSISIDVTRDISALCVDRSNKNYDAWAQWDSDEMLHLDGMYRYEYEIIDDYIDVISTASTIKSFDPNILIIISEEIPAYFADQKSIEDVAGIITKRAQTVVDERNT